MGLHVLLRVRIFYYACRYVITREDNLIGVRICYYACGYFFNGAEAVGSMSGKELRRQGARAYGRESGGGG